MTQLRVLRLYGNPLEFLPEILPLHNLCHLSLANVRIVADKNLRSVNVQIEVTLNKVTWLLFGSILLNHSCIQSNIFSIGIADGKQFVFCCF